MIDFLIMPVQRIPRYSLLLRELIKHTPPSHPDLKGLQQALERVDGIAVFLNEEKRRAEEYALIVALQEKLVPSKTRSKLVSLTSGFRRIVREEDVWLLQPLPGSPRRRCRPHTHTPLLPPSCPRPPTDGHWREQKCHLIVLSDMLLIVEKRTSFGQEQYLVKEQWFVNELFPMAPGYQHTHGARFVLQLMRCAVAHSAGRTRSLSVALSDEGAAAAAAADGAGPGLGAAAGAPGAGAGPERDADTPLERLLRADDGRLLAAVAGAVNSADLLAEASALAVYALRHGLGALVLRLLRADGGAGSRSSSLLRTSSLGAVTCVRFVKLACADYVVKLLRPWMLEFVAVAGAAVDPDAAADGAAVRKELIFQTQHLLDTICDSAGAVPGEARALLQALWDMNDAADQGAALGQAWALVVDRLFVPVLVQPVTHGLLDAEPSPAHARALELVRSVVARLAANAPYDYGSPAAFMNPTIKLYAPKLNAFVRDVSTFDRFSTAAPKAPPVSRVLYLNAMADVTHVLATLLPALGRADLPGNTYRSLCEALAVESVRATRAGGASSTSSQRCCRRDRLRPRRRSRRWCWRRWRARSGVSRWTGSWSWAR